MLLYFHLILSNSSGHRYVSFIIATLFLAHGVEWSSKSYVDYTLLYLVMFIAISSNLYQFLIREEKFKIDISAEKSSRIRWIYFNVNVQKFDSKILTYPTIVFSNICVSHIYLKSQHYNLLLNEKSNRTYNALTQHHTNSFIVARKQKHRIWLCSNS